MLPYINIHTHRPTGRGIELRTAGIHPWEADSQDVEAFVRTAGIHPWEADSQDVEAFVARLADKDGSAGTGVDGEAAAGRGLVGDGVAGVQAIGETGLDFACPVPREAQFAALRAQLALARRTGRPVVLHCVRAFEPLMRELAACEPRAVIFHGFIGSPEQARQALRRGYYLSFGARAFASPKTLRALRETPLGQLFFETDDAEVTIEEIYARAAEASGRPVEELQRATLENYKRLFETQNG